ncbi:MAG: hypothetical protein IPJ20_23525 [Flammeovirgaceae bacterium]|nr:hypothetical protein [Flammeovirgaceae bacterium]
MPDDLSSTDARKGWNNVTQATGVHAFASAADITSANWTSLNGLIVGDTEPDIFYMNAPD